MIPKNRVVSSPTAGGPILDNPDPFGDGSGLALYKFEDDVTDETGNYDGTATAITYSTGEFGKSAKASGNSDIATSLGGTFSALTLSFWFKYGVTHTRQYMFWPSAGYMLSTGYSGGVLFQLYLNGSVQYQELGTSPIPRDGNFHHVVITWDKTLNSGKPIVYVDNLEYTMGGVIGLTSDWVVANAKLIDSSDTTNPELDQYRIFNRQITAEEVSILFNESI